MKHNPTWNTWLTSPVRGSTRTTTPAVYFRRKFSLKKMPEAKVTLHITVLGLADVEINGQRISDDTFVPGWPDYRFRTYYRSYDVTPFLEKGDNAIGVTLGNGWYTGYVGMMYRQNYGQQPLFSLTLVDEKKNTIVETDEKWRYNDHGPIVENDIMQGECYDARLELGAWSSPDYTAKGRNGWYRAFIAETPELTVDPAVAPAVRPQETFEAREISNNFDFHHSHYTRTFDFGQNMAGRIRLRVKGPCGTSISLRHAEILDADGSIYTTNLRTARATDTYTCKGTGDWEEWEPRFTFHGFRYCEASWFRFMDLNKEVEVSLEAVALYSDMPRTGELECSHPLLNQLISNTRWSQKGNFLDIPTDCPQRDERLGWTGDAQAFIRTAAFFHDVDAFFRQWLTSIRDSQSIHDGAVPPFSPLVGWQMPDGGPGWGDAIFICPWTAYLCYGDKTILRENFQGMCDYLKYIENVTCVDGVRSHPESKAYRGFGDWLAVDPMGVPVTTSYELIGTAFHAYGAEITARTAEVLGKDAKPFWMLHGKIVETFRKNFLNEQGLPKEQTQAAHVLALQFHLVPDETRQAAGDRLAELVKENNYHMNTGFLATPYILTVLEDTGHLDLAYRILTQETFPSWLFPVKNGATTIWERWDSWTPERGFHPDGMNSFNHYAYGAVCAWMVTTMAGLELDPADPAYHHIVFKPRPGGGLTQARAALQTRYGHTAIAWEIKEGVFHVTLDVPEGTYATLSLPPEYQNTAPDRIEPGHYELEFS